MVDAHDARLAQALEDAGYGPSAVARAREGYWSDFKSTLAFPKVNLVGMLQDDDELDLAKRVVAGEFDG